MLHRLCLLSRHLRLWLPITSFPLNGPPPALDQLPPIRLSLFRVSRGDIYLWGYQICNSGYCLLNHTSSKENMISTGSIFGRIGVRLRIKDRNPTRESYPKSYPMVGTVLFCLDYGPKYLTSLLLGLLCFTSFRLAILKTEGKYRRRRGISTS